MAKQRQVRIEQRGALAQMQALETKSDEELMREQKFKSAAYAILGSRAAERYDAAASREWFRKAVAAARPQERMQLRRMADASIALAERRPDDLRTSMERLGQQAPTKRQLLALRFMGLVAPPPGSSPWLRVRGIAIILGILFLLLALGFLLSTLISLPFGGWSLGADIFMSFFLVIVALGVLVVVGRRRQRKAVAARAQR